MRCLKFIYLLLLSLALFSCKSLKKISASDKTNTAAKSKQQKDRNVQFIDGISVSPGSPVTSAQTTGSVVRKKKERVDQGDFLLTNFNIEKADWLQLKYAIVLDATVEKLANLLLLQSIDHWWGTRYCMGGSTENCIDCSSFTQTVMRDVYGLTIARTAQEQFNNSTRVNMEDMKEGDLVFFHTTGRAISHVGIYLLNNKFVHAATSGGVMVSDLNDSYWKARFRGAGRVLTN